MISHVAARGASAPLQVLTRRGFHTTRARLSSPFHYPEGPLSNIPFNPKAKLFPFGYWTFMAVGFGTPFAIAAWKESKAPES